MTNLSESGSFVLPTGTVAFLLTDVEESSKQWGSDADAMQTAMVRHDAILDEVVSAHGGVRPTAQGEGDSIVAAFARASDAVLAAREAQLAFVAHHWPTADPIRVRMAVHSGEARFVDSDSYAGQAIIRTARLRSIAHGGQVLVSAPARDLTVDQLGDEVHFLDLGEHRLRDLARPERVWQLAHPDLPSQFPPLASLDAHHQNLPVQLSSFVGRVDDIATVASLLADNRLVTITGTGGSGKTRLALQVAAEFVGRWRDGTWWVELAELSDPDAVAAAIAASVGVKGELGAGAADALAGIVASREMLVVLDNCEHLVAGVARVVDRLMRRCAGLRVLTTSREPLDVTSEVTWRIPPLALPDPHQAMPIPALAQVDSVRLFLDRAQHQRPNFHLNDDVAPIVAGICDRLDGIPLAIELAAARVRSLTVSQILAGLDDAFRLLASNSRTALPRQATLEASISWSHELLHADEQILLRRLSVFSGGCTLDDGEAVVADDDLTAPQVLDLIDRLVAQSLVTLDDRGATARYRLLETVRQYAARRLADAGETEALRTQHANHYAQLAVEIGPALEGAAEHIPAARLAPEVDNIRAALTTFADRSEWSSLASVCCAFFQLWVVSDPADGEAWVSRALEHVEPQRAGLRARLLFARAWLQLGGGNMFAAAVDARDALEAAEAAGDERTAGRAMGYLAAVSGMIDPTTGEAPFERAVERLRAAGDLYGEAWTRCAWSVTTLAVLGDLERGWAVAADTERAVHAAANLWVSAFHHAVVANGLCVQADFAGALAAAAAADAALQAGIEAAGVDRGLHYRRSLSGAYTTFAKVWAEFGSGREPDHESLERAVVSASAEGFHFAATVLAFGRACLEVWGDDPEAALLNLEPVVSRARAMGFTVLWAGGMGFCAYAEYGRGEHGRALALLDEVEAAVDWPYYQLPRNRCCRAAVLLARHDVVKAEALAHEALDLALQYDLRLETVVSFELLAAIAAANGSVVEAARLYGAGRGLREAHDLFLFWPGERNRMTADLASLQTSMGDDAFRNAFAEGTALSRDQAAEFARRARGERGRPSLGWASLTPTELQVVDLIREGLTNRAIGSRLLMSPETVKTHLSHVFTKLGVTSRSALAAAAASRPESV
jgi:predicted ATPase/class 3 adenylate cyclase/DNA-binding CsgD family transcriptional regulator